MRPDRGEIDRGGEGEERLVRADVARRLVAANVLFPGPHRHDERALAIEVGCHPDEPPGDLADEGIGRGEYPQIRAAVLGRDAKRLTLSGGDVGAVGTRWCEDGQADRLDDRHEQGPRCVREPADLGHRLEKAEGVRLSGENAGDRMIRVGEEPLQGSQVGRPGRRPVTNERDLVDDQLAAAEVRRRCFPVVAVDSAGDEDPLAPGLATGHQCRFGRGGSPIVMRRRHDIEAGQLADHRLVFVDRLERALAHLGLVGRVRRVPLSPKQQLVDRGRNPVAVDTRAEERGEVGPIAGGQRLEAGCELELGDGIREPQLARPEIPRDVVEEGIHVVDPDRREHRGAILGGVGSVGHRVSRPPRACRRPRDREARRADSHRRP